MQSVKEDKTRPLFGVSGEVCSEKAQKELDRVSSVRDVRLFVSKRNQRIHAHRSPRRNITRRSRHQSE
jgi:hypothetical protein